MLKFKYVEKSFCLLYQCDLTCNPIIKTYYSGYSPWVHVQCDGPPAFSVQWSGRWHKCLRLRWHPGSGRAPWADAPARVRRTPDSDSGSRRTHHGGARMEMSRSSESDHHHHHRRLPLHRGPSPDTPSGTGRKHRWATETRVIPADACHWT